MILSVFSFKIQCNSPYSSVSSLYLLLCFNPFNVILVLQKLWWWQIKLSIPMSVRFLWMTVSVVMSGPAQIPLEYPFFKDTCPSGPTIFMAGRIGGLCWQTEHCLTIDLIQKLLMDAEVLLVSIELLSK